MAATIGIALPTGIKLYRWNARILGNRIRLSLPSLWVYGFICMLTLGGTTGVVLANTVIDIVLHDTLLVVGHFHYVLSIGAVIRIGAGLLFWGPLLRGCTPNKVWSLGGFLAFLVGVNLLLLPTHLVGLNGGPRRYGYLPDTFARLLKVSTLGRTLAFNGLCCILFGVFLGAIQVRALVRGNTSHSLDT
jgi:cytochrome c oxidase subunit 1